LLDCLESLTTISFKIRKIFVKQSLKF